MPKNCYDCPCHDGEIGECRATGSRETWCSEPPRSCSLKSADGLIEKFSMVNGCGDFIAAHDVIKVIKEYCEVEE